MEITRGRIPCGQKVIIYGPEGIGKTTLAASFPNPVFIDTEGSTKNFDVARFPAPTSWEMLKQEAEYPLTHPGEVGTLVIDTADWAEKLCNRCVCQRAGKKGIEDFGYGKGYVFSAEEFGRLLDSLDRVTLAGTHVVVTAHTTLRKVEQPDEMTSYDRWELKCSKYLSPLIKEWADMVLFCNYKTIVVKADGSQKGKAQGGRRVMYATHHTCWDAKNRHGLPDEMPMDYSQIAHIFAPAVQTPPTSAPVPPTVAPEPPAVSAAQIMPENPTPAATNVAPAAPASATPATAKDASTDDDVPPFTFSNSLKGIYPPLADLLRENQVTPSEIRLVVGGKGYFPLDMPVQDYPQEFIEGCLIAAWPQVFEAVKADRAELPF